MKKSKKSQKNISLNNKLGLLIALILTSLLYLRLGRDTLFDWDEGIYAQLGSELLQSGNLLTPSWNREIWLEKPPGISWITAFGMALIGKVEIGARLFMPLFGGLTLYFTYKIGKLIHGKKLGIIAMLILANMNLFLSRSRAVNTDGPLLAGMTILAYAALIGTSPPIMGAIIFFTVWVKGVVGFLPLILILPLYINNKKEYIKILLYSLLFTLPWHIYQWFKNKDLFITPYFKEQILRRITTPIEFHLESRWFYFNYLYENLGIGILTLAFVGALIAFWKFTTTKNEKNLLLIWWSTLPIVLFTLAKTRLFWYILPIYPALALLIALTLTTLAKEKLLKQLLSVFIVFYFIYSTGTIFNSIEFDRTKRETPSRIEVVKNLSSDKELAILVSRSERVAEAILPQDQRISSSFGYGGMPSVVFYYEGPVKFYYNLDEFTEYWQEHEEPLAMIEKEDKDLLDDYIIMTESQEYMGITKD